MAKIKTHISGILLCALSLILVPVLSAKSNKDNSNRGRPAWVNSVESVYGKDKYVAAVGTGKDRQSAEKNAFANLISIFGQSIQVDQTISSLYKDAVKNGVITNWSENTSMQNNISTSSSLDSLVAAEIKEVWDDTKGTLYAAAVMEKSKGAQMYTDMIKTNLAMINKLTNMSPAEKNTLDGYSRYQFAAAVADINVSYVNVLKVIGAPVPGGVENGDHYRLEIVSITKTIPITVTVKGDKTGRVQGAFSKALADLGFRSGGSNSRYLLEAELTITEDVYPGSPYKWARYVVTANLIDTVPSKVVLVPFSMSDREGQSTYELAVNRALGKVEGEIDYGFKNSVSDYLSSLLPKK